MFLRSSVPTSALAAFFLVTAAMAQQLSIAEGNVTGTDKKPVVGALVKFEKINIYYENGDSLSEGRDLGVSATFSVKTDKKGYYYYGALPYGTYQISVEVDGQLRAKVRTNLSPGRQEKPVDFVLRDSAPGASAVVVTTAGPAPDAKNEAQVAKSKDVSDLIAAGKAAVENKQWDTAIQLLTKASDLDPKQVPAWVSLADAWEGAAAQAKSDERAADYEKATAVFEKLIVLRPTEAAIYNNYALALASAGKLDDAKTKLAKAVQLDPKGAGKYHYNLGVLLSNVGQNDAAADEFKSATEADPTYAEAQFQYGMALAGKASMDAAGKMIAPPGMEAALRKYVELKPSGANSEQAKAILSMLAGAKK